MIASLGARASNCSSEGLTQSFSFQNAQNAIMLKWALSAVGADWLGGAGTSGSREEWELLLAFTPELRAKNLQPRGIIEAFVLRLQESPVGFPIGSVVLGPRKQGFVLDVL